MLRGRRRRVAVTRRAAVFLGQCDADQLFDVAQIGHFLARAGITADAIHGNKSQNHRERVLAAFRSGEIRTLVATDIAARGIDVDGISHVVNFDLPNVPETYVHRIGRTAAGAASRGTVRAAHPCRPGQ